MKNLEITVSEKHSRSGKVEHNVLKHVFVDKIDRYSLSMSSHLLATKDLLTLEEHEAPFLITLPYLERVLLAITKPGVCACEAPDWNGHGNYCIWRILANHIFLTCNVARNVKFDTGKIYGAVLNLSGYLLSARDIMSLGSTFGWMNNKEGITVVDAIPYERSKADVRENLLRGMGTAHINRFFIQSLLGDNEFFDGFNFMDKSNIVIAPQNKETFRLLTYCLYDLCQESDENSCPQVYGISKNNEFENKRLLI